MTKKPMSLSGTFSQWVPALIPAPLFLTATDQSSNRDQVVSSRFKQLPFFGIEHGFCGNDTFPSKIRDFQFVFGFSEMLDCFRMLSRSILSSSSWRSMLREWIDDCSYIVLVS
jgi:hypothetical protein